MLFSCNYFSQTKSSLLIQQCRLKPKFYCVHFPLATFPIAFGAFFTVETPSAPVFSNNVKPALSRPCHTVSKLNTAKNYLCIKLEYMYILKVVGL